VSKFFFSETVAAALADQTVRLAALLFFDFRSGPVRIWSGYGDLITQDGNKWKGFGDLGQISGLDQAINGAAPQITLTVSEVTADGMRAATNSWAEARGRQLIFYLQFFQAGGPLLDLPMPISIMTMEQIELNFKGPGQRDLVVHAESIFSARGFPIHGWLFPGDKGCERIPLLQLHVVTWPRA
jgi:hypothetical protein